MKTALLAFVIISVSALGAAGSPLEARDSSPKVERATKILFGNSCKNISLNSSNAVLTAACLNTAGTSTITTSISLNSCIANTDGQLLIKAGGDFAASCFDLSLANTVLDAVCPNTAGTADFSASIDLNSVLSNNNGHLTCP